MHFKLLSILFIAISLLSCSEEQVKSEKKPAQKCVLPMSSGKDPLKKTDLLATVPFRKAPLVDTTNFDNFRKENRLSEELVAKLQLRSIEPGYETFYSGYRLALSTAVDLLVITMTIEHEMKTFLISYRKKDYKLIDKLMISYDEIAESLSRTESRIGANEVVVKSYSYWGEEPSVQIKKYRIEKTGEFRLIN
jgi:hypothetical protein